MDEEKWCPHKCILWCSVTEYAVAADTVRFVPDSTNRSALTHAVPHQRVFLYEVYFMSNARYI